MQKYLITVTCWIALAVVLNAEQKQNTQTNGYNILKGHGLDRNVVVADKKTDDVCLFYALNPCWWPVQIELTLKQKAEVIDQDSGKPVSRRGKPLKFEIPGYGARRFSTTVDNGPKSAKTSVKSPEARAYLESRIILLDDMAELNPTELSLALRIIGIDKRGLKKEIAGLKRAFKDNNYLLVRDKLRSPVIAKWGNFLRERRYLMVDNTVSEQQEIPSSYRINCGAPKPYKDSNGNIWAKDQRLSAHEFILGLKTWGSDGGEDTVRGPVEVANTDEDPLYQTERFGSSGYLFRLPNGRYLVKLHFAETWSKAIRKPGFRVFDVTLNGKDVLKEFDVAAAAGGGRKAVIKEFPVTVSDGTLSVGFNQGNIPSIINAVEIKPASK